MRCAVTGAKLWGVPGLECLSSGLTYTTMNVIETITPAMIVLMLFLPLAFAMMMRLGKGRRVFEGALVKALLDGTSFVVSFALIVFYPTVSLTVLQVSTTTAFLLFRVFALNLMP